MMRWIVTAVLATMVIVVGPGRTQPAAAASSQSYTDLSRVVNGSAKPTDISAHRRYHHHYRYGYPHYRYGYSRQYYRPYPRYYARPYYYEPYPYYAPAPLFPFGFGFGFGRW